MMGIHHFETSTTASWKRSLDCKRPLGYHSNSYSWKGKERTSPFGQTARVCTGKQTNLCFSEGILPRQLEFSFFDGEINVNFEWYTLCALGRCTRVKVIRVEVSQNVVHARTTGWMTSTRPGKLRDFGLQLRGSNPRARNLVLSSQSEKHLVLELWRSG